MTGRVAVVGSLNVDRTFAVEHLPKGGHTISTRHSTTAPGGKGGNQAVAASKLGAEVAIVGAVGDDPNGRYLLHSISRHGVDASRVAVTDASSTGEAFIFVSRDAENVIVVQGGANLLVGAEAVHAGALDAEVVVASFEVSDEAVNEAAARAHAIGARFILNPSPVRELSRGLLRPIDVLVLNEHEFLELCECSVDAPEAAEALNRIFGRCNVVITRGSRGATLYETSARSSRHVPAPRVEAVDTTGCGDAFLGALAAELAEGGDLGQAVAVAVEVGAIAAQSRGAQSSFPSRDALRGR